MSAKDYRDWFATLPAELTDAVTAHWGPPPGELFVDRTNDPDGEIVIAAMQAGNLVLMVQPPRGFGENPVAIYHDPDLPPSHHYLAAYRWLDTGFGAPTPSCIWASTATWSGCRARRWACRRPADPTPRWATCR